MKKPFYVFVLCSLCFLLITDQMSAQTQEKSIPETEETHDDLAPFPFDDVDKPEEKKTIGEKVKEKFQKDQEAHNQKPKEGVSEDPIRFYEFEDITFADEKEEEPVNETHTKGDFKWVKDENKSEDDYYKDVTFDDEIEKGDDEVYDDQTFSPYKDSYYKPVEEEKEEKKEEKMKSDRPVKPIEIKDKDYYKQDYNYYYYNRKKKGNGEPGTYPDYTNEINKSKRKIKDRIRENRDDRDNN